MSSLDTATGRRPRLSSKHDLETLSLAAPALAAEPLYLLLDMAIGPARCKPVRVLHHRDGRQGGRSGRSAKRDAGCHTESFPELT
jgi:hypothetical protein